MNDGIYENPYFKQLIKWYIPTVEPKQIPEKKKI